MSLTIRSTNPELDSEVQRIIADGAASPGEFQKIRDHADEQIDLFNKNDTSAAAESYSLMKFQNLADDLVETLQQIALTARKEKINAASRTALKSAVEHHIAYIVVGYQSSIERL